MEDRLALRIKKCEALREEVMDQLNRSTIRLRYLTNELKPSFEQDMKKNEKHKAKDPSDHRRAQYEYSLGELRQVENEMNEAARNLKAYEFYLDYLEEMISEYREKQDKVN